MPEIKEKIQQYQSYTFYVFIPSAGIALFSDYWIFEIFAFISSIVFATLIFIESQV